MGSANGRHRRPRQAPALVVAAGVTGSALAIPLFAATGASAADATTWDKVAECESGGAWSADFGNGQYGGLQFSPETWKAYGGTAYAPRADLASRAQQIAVAEKVLADRGPLAWPSCAVISGLTLDEGLAVVDPGATTGDTGTQDPATRTPAAGSGTTKAPAAGESDRTSGATDSADDSDAATTTDPASPDASAPPSAAPSADASPSGDPQGATGATGSTGSTGSTGATGATGSIGSTGSESSAPAGGKHRGPAAADESAGTDGATDSGRDVGRHASRGGAEAREGGAQSADGSYTVRAGDNLWSIADAQKLDGGWTALYEANKETVGADPDLILPGQSLDLGLPEAADATAGN